MHKDVYISLTEEFEAKQTVAEKLQIQRHVLSYNELRDEVLQFLIKENLPLHKLESPHLKRLISRKLFGFRSSHFSFHPVSRSFSF